MSSREERTHKGHEKTEGKNQRGGTTINVKERMNRRRRDPTKGTRVLFFPFRGSWRGFGREAGGQCKEKRRETTGPSTEWSLD